MKIKKTSASLSLVLLMICLMLPQVYAIVYTWTGAPDKLVISAAKYFSSSYRGGGGVLGFFIMLVFLLAVIGIVIGYVLWEKVKGRHMMIGSAVYWTFALLYLSVIVVYITSFRVFSLEQPFLWGLWVATLFSTPAVLSSNITYIIACALKKRKPNLNKEGSSREISR